MFDSVLVGYIYENEKGEFLTRALVRSFGQMPLLELGSTIYKDQATVFQYKLDVKTFDRKYSNILPKKFVESFNPVRVKRTEKYLGIFEFEILEDLDEYEVSDELFI